MMHTLHCHRQWSIVYEWRLANLLLGNGVQHVTTATYHPASNRQAQRAVHVFKHGFKWIKDGTVTDQIEWHHNLRLIDHQQSSCLVGTVAHVWSCCFHAGITARVESQQQRQKAMHAHNIHTWVGVRSQFPPRCIVVRRLYTHNQGPSYSLGETEGWSSDQETCRPYQEIPLLIKFGPSHQSSTPIAKDLLTEEDIAMQAGSPEAFPTTLHGSSCYIWVTSPVHLHHSPQCLIIFHVPDRYWCW